MGVRESIKFGMERRAFFLMRRLLGDAETFSGVRLKTGYSRTMPDHVDLTSRLTRHMMIKVPILGAAMDTVTEYRMAIALAEHGGIGVIHKNLSEREQARHVGRVKHELNVETGLVERPITVKPGDTLAQILERCERQEYHFHSFPVVDEKQRMLGLVTGAHFDFYYDSLDRQVREVMQQEVITGSPGMSQEEAFDRMQQNLIKVLPLVDSEGRMDGMYVFKNLKLLRSGEAARYNVDERGRLRVAGAIGTGEGALSRAEALIRKGVDLLVIDTAHGDSEPVYRTIKQLKGTFPDVELMAGNISEPESALRLAKAGVDAIKVGQGPGSICTTRVVAGIGCPQVTAIYECARVAHKYGVPVCGDGGIVHPGDIPIAIGAGADTVMIGSGLAATLESPGKVIFLDGRQWKAYRGMGSLGAMEENTESRSRYNQNGKGDMVPEGVEGRLPYKGPMDEVFVQLVGGLRRGMGYVGAASIEELHRKARFRGLGSAGLQESHPHGITITREAPNYRAR